MQLVFGAKGNPKPVYAFSPTSVTLDEGQSATINVLKNGSAAVVQAVSSPSAKFTASVGATPGTFSVKFVGPADPVADTTVALAVDVA